MSNVIEPIGGFAKCPRCKVSTKISAFGLYKRVLNGPLCPLCGKVANWMANDLGAKLYRDGILKLTAKAAKAAVGKKEGP